MTSEPWSQRPSESQIRSVPQKTIISKLVYSFIVVSQKLKTALLFLTVLLVTPVAGMLLSSIVLALCAFIVKNEAGPSRKHAQYDRRALNSRPAVLESRKSSSSYLTNKTAPFAVNGSALPDVHFNIVRKNLWLPLARPRR